MTTGERLFEPFMDPVDGILCLPAKSNAAAIEGEALPQGLRFPLLLDEVTPFCDQVASSPFAPASSRYGPYCDNITGVNWELPDGRKLRVGERVVKSTTGYDVLRFLLGSGERYGRPLDYVLRLRPASDRAVLFRLFGGIAALRMAISVLLRSSWMHWFDSVDIIVENEGSPFLRVAVNTPAEELPAYFDFLKGVAIKCALSMETTPGVVLDGCPDLVVKTSPEFVLDTAIDLARTPGAKCIALCYSGVVHAFLPEEQREAISRIVRPIESTLLSIGGHWQSIHQKRTPSPIEEEWLSILRRELNIP